MTKALFYSLLIAIILIGFASCDIESYPMEGDWTISTTTSTGTNLGNGTYTLTFWQEIEALGNTWVYYQGTGTIGGTPYDFYLSIDTGDPIDGYDLTLYTAGTDPSTIPPDWMDFEGDTDGSPITGVYNGFGIYSANTGTFTTSKL
ncbi:MAG: hypothetical protein JXJ04_07340 [Spirochaetales bacterium]|nr:hypothetical protein [Spirochaetales bacterium]